MMGIWRKETNRVIPLHENHKQKRILIDNKKGSEAAFFA